MTCFLGIRYVDNRFILFDEVRSTDPALQVLADPLFYQAPVELETVDDHLMLGFKVDHVQCTIRFQIPELWKIRDRFSSGSLRLRLSGLKSRAHVIKKYTYPSEYVEQDVACLFHLYVRKGFTYEDCTRAVRSKSLLCSFLASCLRVCVHACL